MSECQCCCNTAPQPGCLQRRKLLASPAPASLAFAVASACISSSLWQRCGLSCSWSIQTLHVAVIKANGLLSHDAILCVHQRLRWGQLLPTCKGQGVHLSGLPDGTPGFFPGCQSKRGFLRCLKLNVLMTELQVPIPALSPKMLAL